MSILKEPNCLHFKFSILLGISEPAYDESELARYKAEDKKKITFEGKEYTMYEASQLQRQIETEVRHQKDRSIIAKAAGNTTMQTKAQLRINQLTDKYTKLSDASGLPTKMERMNVRGFKTMKLPKKSLTNSSEDGIIQLNKVGGDSTRITREELKVEFTQEGIRKIADKYGINIEGKRFVIEQEEEHFRIPFFGRTDKDDIGRIDLYPRAFLTEENMARTLVHEHIHYLQLKKYGKKYCDDNTNIMEKEAYRFEDIWYSYICKRRERYELVKK